MAIQDKITIEQLKSGLNFDQIGGWDDQMEMAPQGRLKLDKSAIKLKNPREAAVIFLIYQEDDQLNFPVILRNTYQGVHSNQISLPGGKIELEDKDLAATAIRECNEEIGANPAHVEILGKLTDLYIPPSNFLVHPFVAVYHHTPDFVRCDIEVQKIIRIPLDDFVMFREEIFNIADAAGISRDVPAYSLKNDLKIWGATAMILNEFRLLVKKSLNL